MAGVRMSQSHQRRVWLGSEGWTLALPDSQSAPTANTLKAKASLPRCSSPVDDNITVRFLYQEDNRILPYQLKPIINDLPELTLESGRTRYEVRIVAKNVGELFVYINHSSTQELE